MRALLRLAGRLVRRALGLSAASLAAAGGCREAPPLRVGVVVSENAVAGARVAAEAVNVAGGIGGRRLELVVLPGWATDADEAIRGAERLADDPTVLAVVGHGNSTATLASSQVYNARGLVQVAPTSTAPILRQAGPYSFRVVPGDEKQAAFLASEARRLARVRRAAIVYVNDDYGRGLHLALRREMAAHGIENLASVPYIAASGARALEVFSGRLARQRPEVVFWLGHDARLPEFLPALDSALPGTLVLASDGVDVAKLYEQPARYAGLHFVRFVDPAAEGPCMARLRAHAGARMGGRAENVLVHDAVLVVVEALRAGARTREGVRRSLSQVGHARPPVRGCAGPIRFDSLGDADRPYLLARADSSGIHPVDGPP